MLAQIGVEVGAMLVETPTDVTVLLDPNLTVRERDLLTAQLLSDEQYEELLCELLSA